MVYQEFTDDSPDRRRAESRMEADGLLPTFWQGVEEAAQVPEIGLYFLPQQIDRDPVALLYPGQTARIRPRPAERHRVTLISIYHIPGLLHPELDELCEVTPHLTSLPLLARRRIGVGKARGRHGDIPETRLDRVDPRQPFVEFSQCDQPFVASTLPPFGH